MTPDQNKQVLNINLTTPLDAIPDGQSCLVCGSQTDKAFVKHQLGFNEHVLFESENAAGYKCPNDDMTYLSKEAVIEMLIKAREQLVLSDNLPLVEKVDRSILFERGVSVNS